MSHICMSECVNKIIFILIPAARTEFRYRTHLHHCKWQCGTRMCQPCPYPPPIGRCVSDKIRIQKWLGSDKCVYIGCQRSILGLGYNRSLITGCNTDPYYK